MEFFTILLSGLLGLVSPAGLLIDRTAENFIRSQFEKVEQLQVRVDNAPSHQLLQGKVERVLIAGRGLQLKQQDIRVAALEVETDPIDLEPSSLGQGKPKLKRPFQAGVHLVLNQQDINQALHSPAVVATLRDLGIEELGNLDDTEQRYNFVNPRVELLANNRLRFQVELREQGNNQPLSITVDSGLGVVAGRQIQLVEPAVYVNQEAVTDEFVKAIATNFSQQLDLGNLEVYGLRARILQLKVNPQQLEIAAFLRVEPSARFLESRRSSI